MADPHPTPHRWLILGAGGHGRSVADAIRATGDALLGFLDDGPAAAELVGGDSVLGPLALAWDVKTLSLPRFHGQCLESCFYTDPMKTNDHNECPVYATPLQR